jgi:tetratricopeptide (TPR) repeat protein
VKDQPLDDETVAIVTELCERGDADVEAGLYDDAIAKYKDALGLLPEPTQAWKAATWILTAIGEAALYKGDAAHAKEALLGAVGTESGGTNALVHLRLGQAERALGELGRAKDELYRAFERGGVAVFDGEDPELFAMIEARVRDMSDR